jgi:LysR family glycine cleavage system transcriptional activator
MREKIARMSSRMPPLHAVRVFAAAARHLSFTRAAAELHVTHGAVSRQVRTLEDFLGTPLFERRIRQVLLTPAGQRFHAEVEPALAQIALAAQAMRGPAPVQSVRVNVRPSFAVRWLIPRLPGFVARHPEIVPQVVTSTVAPGAPAAEPFDIAIRRGLAGWPPGLRLEPLLQDAALVVGAPALLRARPVAVPQDLVAHVLLASHSRAEDWTRWLRLAGTPRLKPAGWLHFDHLHFVLQAALDGLGLALAPASTVVQDLASGRLQAPLPALRLPLERYYTGMASDAGAPAQAFLAWLEGEAGAQPRGLATQAALP